MAKLNLHGVLLLDKSIGVGSTAAVVATKKLLNAAKAGHTGTLDPMASGLLPLCFGEATKFAGDLLDADKSYLATLQLGSTTDTGDAEGEVLESRPVNVSPADIEPALARWRGVISQVPPMYSAIKRNGKALYEYARAGQVLEREARDVTIYNLQQTAFDGTSLSIDVSCSKGTYIRTLAEDIGNTLGCGAHLTALRRTRVGDLTLQHAITHDQLQALALPDRISQLQPMDTLMSALPAVQLDATYAQRFRHGQRLPMGKPGPNQPVRVYGPVPGATTPVLLGVADWRSDTILAPLRLVVLDS